MPFDNLLESITDEAKIVDSLIDAPTMPSGKQAAVLNYDLGYTLAHEAFGHLCEGDSVIKGDSILENRIGEKIASDCTTIIDDPTQLDQTGSPAFGSYPFDDEGIITQPSILVENWVLMTFMHNRESAQKLKQETTGNARAQSAKYRPQVRMSNTFVQPGDAALEELFETIQNGFFLIDSRGGQTTGQGAFHVGVQLAYEIKKGEIGQIFKGSAIGGKTLDTLSNICLVGHTMDYNIGACGKGDPTQMVYTGSNGPALAVKEIIIGG